MELFLTNIPGGRKKRALELAIAREIKRTFSAGRVKVAYEFQPLSRSPRCAKLTFPTAELGQAFLNGHYDRGLLFNNEYIKVAKSKYDPKDRLVQALQIRMKDDQDLDSDSEESDGVPKTRVIEGGVWFRSLEWGVWSLDGTFGQCGTIQRRGRLTYDRQTAEVQATKILDEFQEYQEESGVDIDNTIIQEILIDRNSPQVKIYFTLDRIPRFWSENRSRHTSKDRSDDDSGNYLAYFLRQLAFDGPMPVYRLPALCSEHALNASYCTVYAFNLDGPDFEIQLARFLKSLKKGNAPNESSVEVTAVPFPMNTTLQQLEHLYNQHNYRIAFQMESLVENCLLLPNEVVKLHSKFLNLASKYEVQTAVRIVQNFAMRLRVRTYESSSHEIDLPRLLRDVQNSRLLWEPRVDPNSVWIHRLDITPAAYNMEGPVWMGGNRFLRLYPKRHDHFLKVTFTEEDLSKISVTKQVSLEVILDTRWGHALKNGVTIAGRHFEFLGFSSSSLGEHSTWFMARFKHNGEEVSAHSLRSILGDFSEIRCPPRLAARIGQTFTTTSHSLELAPDEVERIPDIVCNGCTFSDGVGTISPSMLHRIWDATVPIDTKPVVYQIRLGGSKGVLSLDSTLTGSRVRLRPSMTKFAAANSHLELANKGRTLPFFLNRQMIVILETLGLPAVNLIELEDKEVLHMQAASNDFSAALRLFQQYGLGLSAKLQNILITLRNEDVSNIFDMPFFRKLNSLALSHALKKIKYNTRVPVDNSWTLMGVMDEFGFLKEGEIYVCLMDEGAGIVRYVEGETIVTRMPALHCGDIQSVTAIGKVDKTNPLSSLYNCIVFSCRGQRSVPNMLSGGDLDGDLYQITQNPLLFPPVLELPGSYPSVLPKTLDRQCTIHDIADFFLGFIVNDNLGKICTMHSIIADQSPRGALDEKCVTLCKLASTAVDYPKTGWLADIKTAPQVNTHLKPDYMSHQQLSEDDYIVGVPDSTTPLITLSRTRRDHTLYYRSEKVLGQMYRRIDVPTLLKSWNTNCGWNEEGSMQLWDRIEQNLQKLTPPYQARWWIYMEEATRMFAEYMEEFQEIQRRYHPTPWKRKQLSEEEVFLQCIQMDPRKRHIRGRDRSDYLTGLQQAYGGLVEWVRSQITRTVEGQYQRSAAYFHVGIELSKRRRNQEGQSFSWIIVPDLFGSWKGVVSNGFKDEEAGVEKANHS
jgi:hypothetical protein